MKIYWNGLDLVGLAILGSIVVLCGIALVTMYIVACIKDRRKRSKNK